MRKPLIGITVGVPSPRTADSEGPEAVFACRPTYAKAVKGSGGAPVLLRPRYGGDALAAALDAVDGLLLSGGGDLDSRHYGEDPHLKLANVDPVRDCMELAAVQLALKKGIPILGICRGIQILNVACGGTLVQDIPSAVSHAVQHHTDPSKPDFLAHAADIEQNSLLARTLGTTNIKVNSRHHQAVNAVGKGLRVTARARDQVVEALEAEDGRPILAVQFHPEDCCEKYPLFQKLFDWIVTEAAKRRRG